MLNYMLYVRGNKRDYDTWESLGNPGWGSTEALYYFKKSEDNRDPYLARSLYHSTGGYLTVGEASWRTPLATAFVEAGKELGYENRDCNGEFTKITPVIFKEVYQLNTRWLSVKCAKVHDFRSREVPSGIYDPSGHD